LTQMRAQSTNSSIRRSHSLRIRSDPIRSDPIRFGDEKRQKGMGLSTRRSAAAEPPRTQSEHASLASAQGLAPRACRDWPTSAPGLGHARATHVRAGTWATRARKPTGGAPQPESHRVVGVDRRECREMLHRPQTARACVYVRVRAGWTCSRESDCGCVRASASARVHSVRDYGFHDRMVVREDGLRRGAELGHRVEEHVRLPKALPRVPVCLALRISVLSSTLPTP
jgi:hypothetical protein